MNESHSNFKPLYVIEYFTTLQSRVPSSNKSHYQRFYIKRRELNVFKAKVLPNLFVAVDNAKG